jgi:hypothetical protein
VGSGECDLFVVVLSGLQAVAQTAEESVEQVAWGGGVTVAGGFGVGPSAFGRRVRL